MSYERKKETSMQNFEFSVITWKERHRLNLGGLK